MQSKKAKAVSMKLNDFFSSLFIYLLIVFLFSSGKTSKNVDRSWKKNVESLTENKTLSSSASAQTIDANEESFATASEGSDTDDGCEVQKAKSAYGTTKRSPAVVATKQPRKYRSTSRYAFIF